MQLGDEVNLVVVVSSTFLHKPLSFGTMIIMLIKLRKQHSIHAFILLLTIWMTLANVLQLSKNLQISSVNKPTIVSLCSHAKSIAHSVAKSCQKACSSLNGMLTSEQYVIPYIAAMLSFFMIVIARFTFYPRVAEKPPRALTV